MFEIVVGFGFVFITVWMFRANKRIKNLEKVVKYHILK